jgi:hypothetical protein
MYITDLKHFLDSRGAIGPNKGPARAMAQFQTDVVARRKAEVALAAHGYCSRARRTGAPPIPGNALASTQMPWPMELRAVSPQTGALRLEPVVA